MRFADTVWLTFRHLKSSLVGTLLVILAISIGVALAAATAAYIAEYNYQKDELLNNPTYREVYVESLGDPDSATELELPVVATTDSGDWRRDTDFDVSDMAAIMQSVEGFAYAYLAEGTELTATSYLLESFSSGNRIQGMGMMMGGGGIPGMDGGSPPEGVTDGTTGEMQTPGGESPPEMGTEIPGTASEGFNPEERGDRGEFQGALADGELPDWATIPEGVTELPVDSFYGVYATPDMFSAYGISAAEGSLFTQEDMEVGNMVMVLGYDLANSLFPAGDAIGSRISVNMQTYTILGVLEPNDIEDSQYNKALNDVAFIPHYLYSGISFGRSVRGFGLPTMRFAVEDSDTIASSVTELEEFLRQDYPNANLRVTAAVDQLKSDQQRLSRVLTVLVFLSFAGLLIASINMFNLQLIRIIRQTKNIGVMRALGRTKNNILGHFVLESAVMTFFGAIIGLAASPFLFEFLRSALITLTSDGFASYFSDLLLGAGVAVVISMLFGLYPAYMARSIDTSTALRSE